MAFDAEGFRNAAKGKYSDAEIEAVIARESAGGKSITEEPTKQETQVAPAYDWLKPVAGGLAAGGALLGGKAIYDSLKDKVKATAPARIDPGLDVSTRPTMGEPSLDVQALTPSQTPAVPTIEELKAKFGLPATSEVPVAQPIVQAPVETTPVAQPNVPQAAVAPPVAPNVAEQAAIEALTTPDVAPEGAAPPPAKKPRKVTPKSVPEGMTELVGGGPGDRWLANEHPELRKSIITMFNEGKPAGSYEKAQELYKQFKVYQAENVAGPSIPKEVAKERGMPPPKNYGAWGTKIAKGAGVTGLALTAAEMAQAAEAARQGNYGPARESGFNLLGMIPGIGTAFSALTFSKGAGETPEELQKLQYMQKVGGGQGSRGIAPPTR
jgi:hypothetical protein